MHPNQKVPATNLWRMKLSHLMKCRRTPNFTASSKWEAEKVKINSNHLLTPEGIATVKFSANVQLSGGPMLTLESNLSNPFVIITNECQYEESDGILLKATAFGTQNDAMVAYPFFANLLQRHFLRGTKQDPVKPQRFLSKSELAYLNQKFFNGRQVITAKMYDEFWAWFGKGLQKLRYQRHLLPMWQSGYFSL